LAEWLSGKSACPTHVRPWVQTLVPPPQKKLSTSQW
jgi:hypothetical protein